MATWEYPQTLFASEMLARLQDMADAAILRAQDAAAQQISLASSIPESDTPDSFVPFDFNNLAIVLPTPPTVPTLTEPDLSGDKPVLPVLTMSLVASDVIIDELIAELKAELLARLAGNSVIENALFQRFKDKAIAEFTAAFTSAKSVLSSCGWSRPTGKGQNAVEELYLKSTVAETGSFAREVAIIQHQEQQKVLDQLLSFEANLIGAKAGDESNKIRLYDSEWQGYINNIKVVTDLNQMVTAMYAAQVQGFNGEMSGVGEQARITLSKISAINAAHEQLASISIKTIEMKNAYNLAKFGAQSEAYKTEGGINAQIMSTAMNGMHLGLSYSVGESKSESHSFDG